MANEYLQRTPTSTGNRRVWTWSTWVKRNSLTSTNQNLLCSTEPGLISKLFFNTNDKLDYQNNSPSFELITSQTFRDVGNWFHILFVAETTASISSERIRIYVNGARITKFDTETYPAINSTLIFNYPIAHFISKESSSTNWFIGEFADIFFVDGQALTPDVFGFYKEGKGYISAGSTQATDFRPGQWVPKTPRVIKTEINRRGGFGVNGFYLPMNDSRNFGADFHGEPNSIITLNEKLPQPRVGVVTTASVGLGYTDALRADPFAANLVLALPFVSGGLNSGFGDYAPSIKGSGSAKIITNNTSVSIANTHGYYGSSAYIDSVNYLSSSSADFAMGTDDFTVEGWINQTGGDTTYGGMFSTATSDGSGTGIVIARDQCWLGSNAVAVSVSAPGGTFWPLNQWTHIAFVRKTNTLTVFVNGVAAGITTNVTSNVGKTDSAIGRRYYNNSSFTPIAYIQDLRVYKGVAKYTGGFDVPRPYTPVGIATWRAVPDTTANNFATWNAVQNGMSLTDGNLTCTGTGSNQEVYSTVGITTGKWYVEARTNVGTYNHFGVRANSTTAYDATYRLIARDDGSVYGDTSQGLVGTLSSGYASAGSIVAMAIDGNLGQITYYVNGVNVGGPYSIYQYNSSSLPTSYKIYNLVNSGDSLTVNFGQNPTFSGNTTAGTFTDSNGKGLFKYQPPTGFLALCEDNLPTLAISDPGKYFKTVFYTGDNRDGRSIVGVGFTPDLVWVKARNAAYGHVLFDSVRGPYYLLPSTTGGDNSAGTFGWASGGGLSMLSDGFTVAYGTNQSINETGTNMVAWCWRAGAGTTSTNTNGSITSVVSVNQDAGFSIVSWTGAGSGTSTVGHGLGKQPAFILTKARDSASDNNWVALHKSSGTSVFSHYLYLNSTVAAGALSPIWPATSTTFTTSPGFNSAVRYISYCWAEIEGFSKFGSYSANFSADGPFCYCGFRPAFVIIKRTDSTGSWVLKDSSRNSANPADLSILAQTNDTEFSNNSPIDFLSNGFKLRSTSLNDSGATFIFAAWAESPFQTANSK